MTISMLRPAYAGNSIRIFVSVPDSAERWRILRRRDDDFRGADDPAAVPVYDGSDEKTVLDVNFLLNGVTYFYRLYCLINGSWIEDDTKSVVCGQNVIDGGEDPQMFLRDRLDYGLSELVNSGKLNHPNGKIPVLISPPTFDGTTFPVVVVAFSSGSSSEYGIGNLFGNFKQDDNEMWEIDEGWISDVRLSVVAWSLNADERIALRRAIEFIILSNLSIFDEVGFANIAVQQNDTEDYQSYSVPLYQSATTVSCLAPRYVGHRERRITGVSFNIK